MIAPTRWIFAALLVLGCCRAAGAKPALVIYPGSFDPVHHGHVSELRQVLARLRLERPEGAVALVLPNDDRPRHLPGYTFDADQRAALLHRAFAPLPGARVKPAFRPGLDTFQQLGQLARTYGKRYELHLLLGEDAFRTLRSWRGHERVLSQMNLLVSVDRARMGRAPPLQQQLGAAGAAYRPRGKAEYVDPRSGRSIRYLPTRVPAIRSRGVLMHLMAGLPVDAMVPAPVARTLGRGSFRRAVRRCYRASAEEIAGKARPALGAGAAAAVARDPARLRRLLAAPRGRAERQARARLLATNPPPPLRVRGRSR